MKKQVGILLVVGIIAILAIGAFSYVGFSVKKDNSLKILWAEWPPADYLQELTNEFTQETGIKVEVQQVPWSDFLGVFFGAALEGSSEYDLVVGDSQWLGRGSVEGHYVDLTDFIKEQKIDETMAPSTITGYSEFPKGSEKYWAVPLEGDAMGWVYRKDLFENSAEKEAFKQKYGYELNIPETWYQLRDIAEFFHRPDEGLYGLTLWTSSFADGITMGFETVFFSWGAELGDRSYRSDGVFNSQQGVEALEFYKDLYEFTPPNWEQGFWEEANQAFVEGKVAMSANYFAFFPALVDKEQNPYADNTGFFSNPKGPTGKAHSALGGQGISIVSYSKNKDLAYEFLEWFAKPQAQDRWAELGGYTCHEETLQSQKFLDATPYNRAFMEALKTSKDFWTVPEYADLLKISQETLHNYVVGGQGTAQETMNSVVQQWESVFEENGYYGGGI